MAEPIIKLVNYKELNQTPKGLRIWESYMSQVTQIALHYPNHFTEEVAKKAIPQDATNHYCYLCLLPDGNVAAFCIVIKTFWQAELLWMAVDKKYSGKGIGTFMIKTIESEIFSKEKSIFQIIGKAGTPDSILEGTEIGGDKWRKTNEFYKKLDFEYQYKLEDYWYTGDHAALFIKRRIEDKIGYTALKHPPNPKFHLGSSKKDKHSETNKIIQMYIRKYTQKLFVDLTKVRDPVEKIFAINNSLRGFVGIAFMPCGSDIATIFADLTEETDQKKIYNIFEYKISNSSLTQILSDMNLPDNCVVLYKNKYDTTSQINVHNYFLKYDNELASEKGYSLFLHRYINQKNNSMICFYFLRPFLRNVVVQKRNWDVFSKSSSLILLGISNLLWLNLKTERYDKTYLNSLLECIQIPKNIKLFNKTFRQQVTKVKLLKGEAEKLRAIAEGSYSIAHPLKTRTRQLATEADRIFSDILKVKRGKKDIEELCQYAKRHSQHVKRNFWFAVLSNMLQFSIIKGFENTLIAKDDKGEWRFSTDSQLRDVLSFIKEIGQEMAASEDKKINLVMSPNINISLKGYYKKNNSLLRPQDGYYRELFMEILSNAIRHGKVSPDFNEDILTVNLSIESAKVDNKEICMLSFSNHKLASDPQSSPFLNNHKDKWIKWKPDSPTGLSFISRSLECLNAGQLLCKYSKASSKLDNLWLFSVGLHLHGLIIKE